MKLHRSLFTIRSNTTLCAAILLASSLQLLLAQEPTSTAPAADTQVAATTEQASGADSSGAKISNDELDSLVAPIALYPDPLLAQTLAASTYPIEVMQLGQWLE